MATAKKTTTKKPASSAKATKPAARKTAAAKTATRKAPVKATTVKRAAPKKTTAKKAAPRAAVAKKTTRSSSSQEMRSFHVARNNPPFTSFQVTRQTFYWVILVAFIVFAQLWILSLQVEVASLLDAQQAQLAEMQ